MIEVPYVERGCGDPQTDSMYWMIETVPDGVPIEYYLLDPSRPIPHGIKIRKRGLTMIQVGDTWHIVDHVGSGPYPNAADWFEEARRHKFHQKIDSNLDFSLLDKARSYYFLVHDRIIPKFPDVGRILRAFKNFREGVDLACVHGIQEHLDWLYQPNVDDQYDTCGSFLWADLLKAEYNISMEEIKSGKYSQEDISVYPSTRKTVSVEYKGYSLYSDNKVTWTRGFFAAFPLSIMTSIMYPGKDGKVTDKKLTQIRKGGWVNPIEFARSVRL